MNRSFDFYFDFGTPTTYLAYKALPDLLDRTGASVNYIPFLVGAVMQATDNRPPMAVPAKGRYMALDIARCARHVGCRFQMNPHFPINTLQLQRGAVAMQEEGRLEPYMDAMFDAMWADGRNLGEESEVAAVLEAIEIDPDHFKARIGDPAVKEALKQASAQAVERGAFGAPTFFLGDEMFWGHDRLDHLERALLA